MPRHPIQPLVLDQEKVLRFKQNTIVCHLVDNIPGGLNHLSTLNFPREDWEQLAQLIGYSHSGAGDLSYMSDETLDAAHAMFYGNKTEEQARLDDLQETLDAVRDSMKELIPMLFRIHVEDLEVLS